MNIVNPPESSDQLTRLSPFDRFPDGRPRIPDDIIERMKLVTTEEAWSVLRKHGYHCQFEGDWFRTHPERILVGRAVTAMMVPHRPDLHDLVQEKGEAEGRIGGQNSWVIDTLEIDDVMVVDMRGKVKNGTFVGDNLSTSVMRRTQPARSSTAAFVTSQGISQSDDVAFYCRGMDPTPIRRGDPWSASTSRSASARQRYCRATSCSARPPA